MNVLKSGVYPAMITPYNPDGTIDYEGVDKLVDWYIKNGCSGVFAACQSSEIYQLSMEERIELVKRTVKAANGRIDVVACGAVASDFDEMLEEAKEISKLGIKAQVLLTNHLADENQSDDVLLNNLKRAADALPDIDLGLYEIPVPYKRLLTPEILKWCADSDRFVFMKDTSCNIEQINEKLKVIKGSRLKLFNANSETLLDTVKLGAVGISGIMCNYHPYLYSKMLNDFFEKGDTEEVWSLQHLISTLSYCCTSYPASAKYYLMHNNITKSDISRMGSPMDYNTRIMVDHMYEFTVSVEKYLQAQH